MDLLDSILRTANAEKYLNNFKNANIKAYNLKALVEKDLEHIGVDDPVIRKNVLQNTKNLAIKSENKVNTTVDNNYADIVLMHIANQVVQHHANLICAAKRPDVLNCDVQLEEAVDALMGIILDFKENVKSLQHKIDETNSKRPKVRKVLLWTSILGLFVCGSLIITHKLNK